MSSSTFGFFKRPRSKSEKQVRPPRTVFSDLSSAYSAIAGRSPNRPSAAPSDSAGNAEASGIVSPKSRDRTSPLRTIPDSSHLPVTHDFFQPGPSSPLVSRGHVSLLPSSPPPFSPGLPAGPPPIRPSEIGTKFPTLSYGPGVERRVFHDPHIRSPRLSLENTMTDKDHHAHRRSASMTDLRFLYPNHPSPLNFSRPAGPTYSPNFAFDPSGVRVDFATHTYFGPQNFEQPHVGLPTFRFPELLTEEEQARAFSINDVSEDRVEDLLPPNVLLESRAQDSPDYVRDLRSEMGDFMRNEETSGSEAYQNIDAYEQGEEHDNDVDVSYESNREIEPDASRYDIQSTHSRHSSGTSSLGQYIWSPRGSLYADSVDVEAQPYVHSSTTQGPAGPPSTPLPQLPSQGFRSIDRRAYRDISTTTEQYSHSSESYGNTRNLLGLPPTRIPSGQTSGRSIARLSITDVDGSVHSRSLSEVETHQLEDDIRAHLQPIDETNVLAGSLSISDLSSESQAGEAGPGSSQGSSSFGLEIQAPHEGLDRREGRQSFFDDSCSPSRVRSSTPPLLFGRRALGSNNVDFPEPMPSEVRSNGRFAQALAAAGSRSDSRSTKAIARDEDGDWETDTGSGAFSRQLVREAMAQGETGSSYADNSDSGSLSQSKVIKTSSVEHVVQHSPHARYSQNWTLLQDRESGNMVLALDPQALTSAAATRSPYHHPSPLSKEHTHPYYSSPRLRMSRQVSPLFDKSSRFEARSARSHQSRVREEITNKNFDNESPLSRAMLSGFGTGSMSNDDRRDKVSSRGAGRQGRAYPSSAWLSTVDGDALSDHSDFSSGSGSFAKVTTLGAKANVTGTPEGSGAHQVGISLADASSPIVASSPFVQHIPRTQNPSHDQISHHNQSSPLNPFSRLNQTSHLNQSSPVNPSSLLNQSSSSHLLQIGEASKSGSEPSRLPVAPVSLTRGSSTMANTPPNTVGMRVGGSMPQIFSNSPGHQVRKRSPPSTGDLAINIGSDDSHLVRTPTPNPPRSGDFDVLAASTKDAATETGQAQSQADPGYPGGLPYDSMYGDFLREMRGESVVRAVRPLVRQRQYNRPIARAESPHLHRIPRLTIDETLVRQKELSRAYLWGFVAVFPLLLLFGHGMLDGVMAWHTGGEVTAFRDEDKVVALWVGYGAFAGVFAGLCVVLAFLL